MNITTPSLFDLNVLGIGKNVCIVLLPAVKIQLIVVNFQDTMLVWLTFSALLSYFLAQGKGPDEISQTAKCADSPGLPQTTTGT